MSKTIVVYHSGYGHTKRIAEVVAEGAGAAAFAAALQQRDRLRGQCVGVSLTGANVDAAVLARVLQQA